MSIVLRWIVVCLGLCTARTALAQDLTPRAYLITPVGGNAIILAYAHLKGSLEFAGAVPITGAQADVNLPIASYYRSLAFFGRSANLTIAVPYGEGDFRGTVVDVPRFAHRSGSLDAVVRFSVNLIGGPAMQPGEFLKWRQTVLLGASLTVVAPTGQYDPTRLINWGSNRWGFKPEIGYSQRWDHWVLDGYGGVWFFTTNPEYYPGENPRTQKPVGALEAHLSYDFKPRLWVSLDANYWWGGATSLNGVENQLTDQKSSQIGVTAAFPVTRSQTIKFSYSTGAYVRYGGNYRTVSVAWQYGWIGWPKVH
ncbi:MAG TPA: transporter [Candidatus Sulfotelmatobacter sp.]|nr:transporter [Candidatus Sulfotelmatobacter sp.]